ncbi:MAG: hypothetical protein B0D92_02585 [Spirochaeta sp. LUC14_002_19_P3]|nr:MAG: hypothetical protein B0D92_02585 [Spirochaeta sp. LUC14_002_19_P3]
MNRDSIIYVVIFTFFTAFVFVFLIALADNATAAQVARNQELVTAEAFLNVVGKQSDSSEQALADFKNLFGQVEGEAVVKANVDGTPMLVKQFHGQGLWGTVTGVVATDAAVERFIGLDIISHAETPGLGGRIEEDWFKEQFRGEKILPEGITFRKGEGGADSDSENSAVDGITGASLTSAAMEVIINNEIKTLREAK